MAWAMLCPWPTPGEPARWDRTYGAAFVLAGRSRVYLAGQREPVETDSLYAPPPELACIDRRLPLWQLAAATAFMAVFVTAFSLMTDALRDALDPKLRGLE